MEMLHPEWSYQAVLYEMNVRQLTAEGALRAAARGPLPLRAEIWCCAMRVCRPGMGASLPAGRRTPGLDPRSR